MLVEVLTRLQSGMAQRVTSLLFGARDFPTVNGMTVSGSDVPLTHLGL